MGHGLRIEFSTEERHALLRIGGDFPTAPAAQALFFQEATELVQKSGRSRVLVDLRALGRRLDVPGIFEYVVRNYSEEPPHVRVAVLDRPEHMARSYFFETVMQNSGRDYKLFKDENEALTWLLA
jgi:hypothetical protein